ncbi:MAG TPA: SPOR domain-containing protein, partial [Blastocatellia bacterium]|nr:SPOR domain-containing protein [Blastocatellia bacterium]
DSHTGSENDSSQQSAPVFEEFVSSTSTTDHEYSEVDDSQQIAQSAATESTVESEFEKTNLVEEQIEGPPLSREETAADPWENPLAAWDYSRSEWPALDGGTRQRSFSKKRYAIAAVVLIVSAAGFYFLVLRPSDPQQSVTVNGAKAQVSGVAPLAVPTAPAHSEAPAVAAPTRSENVSAEAPKPAGSPDQETGAGKDAQGQFSLQAAAFATQIGADEFAERLKQAGLASYVVPADLARRGRWYRVRVGRFDSEESAQRFAAEAQRRARAAGIGVQLIVCQYGQP